MKKNKGFVVSTILYSILIAFLIVLGVTLYIFSSATTMVGSATDDLVNATNLSITPIIVNDGENRRNDILAVITSKYGDYYWPKDFNMSVNEDSISGKSSMSMPITINYYCDNNYEELMTMEEKNENGIQSYSYKCNDENISIFYLVVSDGTGSAKSSVVNPYTQQGLN